MFIFTDKSTPHCLILSISSGPFLSWGWVPPASQPILRGIVTGKCYVGHSRSFSIGFWHTLEQEHPPPPPPPENFLLCLLPPISSARSLSLLLTLPQLLPQLALPLCGSFVSSFRPWPLSMTFPSLSSQPLPPFSFLFRFFPPSSGFMEIVALATWGTCSVAHSAPIWGPAHSTARPPHLLVGWEGRQSRSVSSHPHPMTCVWPHSFSQLHGLSHYYMG